MTVDFGIRLPRFAPDRSEHALAYYDRTLNALSEHITTVWLSDHLQFGDQLDLEAWVLIAYLAGAYPRFNYGHLVTCQSFRNPALLAKMGASMQYLTKGRFILGLGAGWHQEEYAAYNFDFPTPGVWVEQLAERSRLCAPCGRNHPPPIRVSTTALSMPTARPSPIQCRPSWSAPTARTRWR
jgi:alkanesulfonate monooxygenase SsuD/methylene tetrahydromethanopterin reductase-like flavin-dependent oxidoreductase (luciferase family)